MSDVVLVGRPEEGVALVRLNRPDARNALSAELRLRLADVFLALGGDNGVRCVVLTGSEKVFAAGADIKAMANARPSEIANNGAASAWKVLREFPKPVIAAVNSWALGGGCELAMHADMIIAGEIARFGQPETYAELQQHVAQAAKGLQHLGIRPGTKVGLFLPNTPHYVISFFAVLRIGAVVVNYSSLDAEKVLEHKIEDSETDVIITLDTPALYPVVNKLLEVTRLQYLVIGNMAEMSAWSSAGGDAASQDAPCHIQWTDRHVRYAELLANDGKYEPVAVRDLQETEVLQYIAGTTGMPKGAMLTHATLKVCGVGTNTPPQRPHKIGSCGVPMCGVTIKFVSVNDPAVQVDYGKQGEICIRGPNVMKGYWKNPEASTSAMTSDGFLRTGDVGYMDNEGFLWIVDRIKDMMLVSGFNVYPRNIEEAIYKHPSVAEVIVIGVRDEYRGQSPKAYVRLKEGADVISLDELKTFLKPHLGKHEMIQALELRSELPKTAVGKLSRKELHDEAKRRVQANDG